MKAITIGTGNKCPKCDRNMERRKHGELIFKKAGGYFSEWDYCASCGHVQHYERFRVKILK